MKILKVVSRKYGTFKLLLDNEDYEKVAQVGRSLRWCVRTNKGRPGLFYFQKRLSNGKLIELHRLIMDFPKGKTVDHINHDTLDNRRKNLRVCSNASNLRNGRVRPNNTSGITGVRFDKKRQKWVATIKVMYKTKFLGRHKNKEEAVRARQNAQERYWAI